jgi:hypothetical protein
LLEKNKKIVKQNLTYTYNISDIQSKLISIIKELSPSIVSIIISKDLNVYYYSDPFALKPYIERKKQKVG